MPKYEYKVLTFAEARGVDKELNKCAAEGWRLMPMTLPIQIGFMVILERVKQD